MNKKLGILFFCIIAGFSCSVDPEIKPQLPVDNIRQVVPEGWPNPVYTFANNPLSENGFELGRALFYEEMLSRDNTISCGSCHQQFVAFAHADHNLSHGIDGLFGIRNAPGLFNLNWNPSFMWDGGVNHIEIQPFAPINNPVEMDGNLNDIIVKLNNSNKYKQLFKNAFGDDSITSQRIFYAITQFQGMLYSYNSKYDYYKRGEVGGEMNAQELSGYNLFVQKCSSCHKEPLFTDYEFRNNGLSVNAILQDTGRSHITGAANDRFKFKTPSLRNVALTAPYMHDGRFNTLDEALNHYTSGIVNYGTLDPILQNGITLSVQEKADIRAFLFTLTDYKFVNDQRFKDPN